MPEMRYANTKILIVTRYCMVRSECCCALEIPSLCLRSKSASPPFRNYRIIGGRAEDHRSYKGCQL